MEPEILFKALADSTRLRALVLISTTGELCVCELTHALEVSQPKISRHLAQLREANVVQDSRAGLWIYYSLHPELPAWARAALTSTLQGIREQSPFAADRLRLQQMTDRPHAARCA